MAEDQKNEGGNISDLLNYFRGSPFTTWDSPVLPPSLLGARISNLVLHYLPRNIITRIVVSRVITLPSTFGL